jgi:hypothetical protein
MCWKCDHPESTIEEWLDAIRTTVAEHGWAVQFVEDDRRPYAYTVGLHEQGLPRAVGDGSVTTASGSAVERGRRVVCVRPPRYD